jgi:hypothetical protein
VTGGAAPICKASTAPAWALPGRTARDRRRIGDATSERSAAGGFQLALQVLPLTVNAVGELLLPLHVPWKPNVVDAPTAMFPL